MNDAIDGHATTSCTSRHSSSGNGSGSGSKPILHEALSMDNRTSIQDKTTGSAQSDVFKWTTFLLLGGITLGAILPQNPALPSATWRLLSSIIGYTYFLSWSASFYPQIIMNYERKTTRGLSVDFCVLNVLGYCCYTVYTTTFFWNQHIIDEYKHRFSSDEGESAEVTVQGNDVAFALHAVVMATVTLSQIGIYDTFTARPPSKRVLVIILSTIAFCIGYVCFTWIVKGSIDFLGFLYVQGTIKVGVTIGKYVPQALLNKARQSTVGWNVLNVILDLTGGVLSLVQLVGDCSNLRDWGGLFGNPTKLFLSMITIAFDLVFLIQHYILYAEKDTYSQLPLEAQEQPSIQTA
ncbi:hypothetical protein ACHAWT_005788 [Skeletonema menzelii]